MVRVCHYYNDVFPIIVLYSVVRASRITRIALFTYYGKPVDTHAIIPHFYAGRDDS